MEIAVLGMAVEETAQLPFGQTLTTVGGSAVNVAIGLRLWGLHPTLVVGGSPAALSALQASGLFGSDLIAVAGPAARSLVEVGRDGSSRVAFAATPPPPFADLPAAALVLLSGFDLLADPEGFTATLHRLRRAGSALWLDLGPAARQGELLTPCLPLLDALFMNQEEAALWTGLTEPGRMLARIAAPEVHIKLGQAGSLARRMRERRRVPAPPAQAVDSTGAGDFYLAGAAATRHLPLRATLAAANWMGARASEVPGAGLHLARLLGAPVTSSGSSTTRP